MLRLLALTLSLLRLTLLLRVGLSGVALHGALMENQRIALALLLRACILGSVSALIATAILSAATRLCECKRRYANHQRA
ncbi:MAG TPA: hypothetical protein VFJ96_11475 [Gemmatimonadaceae bacterium]|nr:hypothetical protein [Gemmatimonadaceae bacterium]